MRLLTKVIIGGALGYAAYRAAKILAPQGIETFIEQVRDGMSEREAQLREAIGLDIPGPDALSAQAAKDLIDDPAGLRPGRHAAPGGRAPRAAQG